MADESGISSDQVFELVIKSIEPRGWDYLLHPIDEAQASVLVDADWYKTMVPQPGGIYSRYANGSSGYSPPGARRLPLVTEELREPATEDLEP